MQNIINNTTEFSKIVNNYKNIFVVRGKKSFYKNGADEFIKDTLNNINYTEFYDFNTNPQLSDLKKGIELFKTKKFDLIITIGGGSVIDMAKLISVFAHQQSNIEKIIKDGTDIKKEKIPLIAIPTTAGTGAEATHFAVIYINKTKYSVANNLILPDWIYLNSKFTYSTNTYLTACAGVDAFCQAIESVWNSNATDESVYFAIEAINIIWNNLQSAVNENNKQAKDKILKAAYLAGKAINITKTTAPHAISYAFTSYYNIPHGHAVALSMPFFFKYNYNVNSNDCTDKRGADKVKSRIDDILKIFNTNIEDVENVLIHFFNAIDININIKEIIKDFDISLIIENVNTERLNNNPRLITKETIKTIFI
jgi:alcohol dehydrogenase class IV